MLCVMRGEAAMKIHLDSNLVLVGMKDLSSVDFECDEIPLKELLESLSQRSPNSPKFLQRDGKTLSPYWEIAVNGRSLAANDDSLNVILRDGDKVTIKLELLAGG